MLPFLDYPNPVCLCVAAVRAVTFDRLLNLLVSVDSVSGATMMGEGSNVLYSEHEELGQSVSACRVRLQPVSPDSKGEMEPADA